MKKRIAFFVCALLCALLIVFNGEAADAARSAFALWQSVLLPSLLPFFVCARFITGCGAFDPADPVVLFTLSFISGAPSGAKLCSYTGAARQDCPYAITLVAASLNTLSPVFVCGAYSSSMLGMPILAVPLITGQLVASLVCYCVCIHAFGPIKRQQQPVIAPQPTAKLFVSSVTDAVSALLSICGMVVFFTVAISVLRASGVLSVLTWPVRMLVCALGGDGESVYAVLSSLIEVASGADALASSGMGLRAIVACSAFAFSFGGLCIAAQSMLFVHIDLGRYLVVKLAQGALAGVCAYLVFPLCVHGAASASASLCEVLDNTVSAAVIFAASLISMSIVMLLSSLKRRLPLSKKDG